MFAGVALIDRALAGSCAIAMSGSTDTSPRLRGVLAEAIDPASIVVFRIAFGLIIAWEAWRYFDHQWIEQIYLRPRYLFTYSGFEWVKPWPGIGLHLHFFAIGVLGTLVAAGLSYRASCLLLCLALWYIVLLDKAAYLNHLYLAALLAGLLAVVPAHSTCSIDARRRPALAQRPMPRWCLSLLRFQIALPYVFGGIAKLNPDWLAGQPMGLWMSRMTQLKPYAPFLDEPAAGLAASYAALILDLAVIPALLWKRTRTLAFVAAVMFHLLNFVMFRIGIFPWMMIVATTLFLSPGWPRRFLPQRSAPEGVAERKGPVVNPLIAAGVLLWISVQLVLPFRHLLFPGRVDWNERGSRFAWRMMVRDKASVLQFIASDPTTGRSQAIDPRNVLLPSQIERMGQYPDMLHQFAKFLSESLTVPDQPPPEVRVVSLVSLNGRKPQPLVAPDVNLAGPLDNTDWIQPLTEPLPTKPWAVPMRDWAQRISTKTR